MTWTLRISALLFALPGALAAQDLVVPEDWSWRLDGEQRLVAEQDLSAGAWRYVRMPPGWHITTTEQGVSLFPRGRVVQGPWGVEAELFLFPDPSDAPLGIVVEAVGEPPGSMQLRFLMRRDGGAALLALRDGQETPMVAWRSNPSVPGHTAGEVVRYVLRVMHEGGSLAFAVNGHEMFRIPSGGEDHPSVPGLRIGPGLNVHVSRFDLITPLAPLRQP